MTYLIVIIILLFLLMTRCEKENYNHRKIKRSNIRSGFRKKGSGAKNIGLHGTRWHKYPKESENLFEY